MGKIYKTSDVAKIIGAHPNTVLSYEKWGYISTVPRSENRYRIYIEHNVDIIKRADWIIDMGPDGGTKGGEIIFEGTPKQLCNCQVSLTAKYI
ncbi:MerR family transcriptional regulator [Clostridium botulinum]|uniref:MerR family transcriptional regulator n=1 Tax=Clostridium botulinum TaxID=1491 RepID=UPI0007732B52